MLPLPLPKKSFLMSHLTAYRLDTGQLKQFQRRNFPLSQFATNHNMHHIVKGQSPLFSTLRKTIKKSKWQEKIYSNNALRQDTRMIIYIFDCFNQKQCWSDSQSLEDHSHIFFIYFSCKYNICLSSHINIQLEHTTLFKIREIEFPNLNTIFSLF